MADGGDVAYFLLFTLYSLQHITLHYSDVLSVVRRPLYVVRVGCVPTLRVVRVRPEHRHRA